MLKVLPAIEAYALTSIATRNLFSASPLEFLLGDLNAQAGPGLLGGVMGPSPTDAISLKELLTNSMNQMQTQTYYSQAMGKTGTRTIVGQTGGVLEEVGQRFMDNMGNIVISTALTTAGFRVAKRVLRKPISMANRQLRAFNLGSTIQI